MSTSDWRKLPKQLLTHVDDETLVVVQSFGENRAVSIKELVEYLLDKRLVDEKPAAEHLNLYDYAKEYFGITLTAYQIAYIKSWADGKPIAKVKQGGITTARKIAAAYLAYSLPPIIQFPRLDTENPYTPKNFERLFGKEFIELVKGEQKDAQN